MNATLTRHWNHINIKCIAEPLNFSVSLIQEVHPEGIKSSVILATKFIIIVNEKEVEEEQLLITVELCPSIIMFKVLSHKQNITNMSSTCNHYVTIHITIHLLSNSYSTCNHSVANV